MLTFPSGPDGFRQETPWRDASLWRFCLGVDGQGRRCTLRWVDRSLTDVQRDSLDALWGRLSVAPPKAHTERILRWGPGPGGTRWVLSDNGGELLTDQLGRRGPIPATEVMLLARQILRGLGALHRAGFVHGGLSPSTIAWTGEWQLTAVGLAPILCPLPPVSLESSIGDVAAYAAPEVLRGSSPGEEADFYALGLTLAESIRGAPVWPWSASDSLVAVLEGRPSGPLYLPDPGTTTGLVSLIGSLTDPSPEVRRAGAGTSAILGQADAPRAPAVTDEDVQFTVYRPKRVKPSRWYTMLAFVHKTDVIDDPVNGEFDPVAQVRREAEALLGPDVGSYRSSASDSAAGLPRGSEILLVPQVEGIEFNPPRRSFSWLEPVHREVFRLRAEERMAGQRPRGALLVFFGSLLIGEVSLSIAVDSSAAADGDEPLDSERARRYRRIFASYSHRDADVVAVVASAARAFGDEVVLDRTHLRSGEVWSEALETLIRDADVFQLFWSSNSMSSPYVRNEWNYALSLDREAFVRPVYWEDPFPEQPEAGLPPEALKRLHFHCLAAAGHSEATPRRAQSTQDMETTAPTPPEAPAPQAPPHVPPPPARSGPASLPPPRAARPRRRALAVVSSTLAVAAALATTLLVGGGGGGMTADRPQVAEVLTDEATLCLAGGPTSTRVTATVTESEAVSLVVLEILAPGADTTTTATRSVMQPTTGSQRAGGDQDFFGILGPFATAGPVEFAVELTDRAGRTDRSLDQSILVLAQC